MITIYANWTGNSLTTGKTVEEAYHWLRDTMYLPGTRFGSGPADLTALDTGPYNTMSGELASLAVARECFAEVTAPAYLRAEG